MALSVNSPIVLNCFDYQALSPNFLPSHRPWTHNGPTMQTDPHDKVPNVPARAALTDRHLRALRPGPAATEEWDKGDTKKIGDTINRLRIESGYTIESLAAAVELSRSAVSRATNSRSIPQPDNLGSYAAVFSERLGREVTVKELLSED